MNKYYQVLDKILPQEKRNQTEGEHTVPSE
jgi:hypothetical protein